jgi:hypothetical protein
MRSIVAALILCVGLTLPGAIPAQAEEASPTPRVVADLTLTLPPGADIRGRLTLDRPAEVHFVAQHHRGREAPSVPINVGFIRDEPGVPLERGPGVYVDRVLNGNDVDLTFQLTPGTYAYWIDNRVPGVVNTPQRADLYITAEPAP